MDNIVGILLYLLFKQHPTIKEFSDNGEFAIYSATMLAMSLYIAFKDYKTVPFKFRKTFGGISVIMLIIASILYFSVTAINTVDIPIEYNRSLMRNLSIYIYLISIILTFLLSGLDKCRTTTDLRNERDKEIDKLEKDFDNIGD